jgi:hypothetical protein
LICFESAWATLKSFKEIQTGMIAVLHMGQNLSLHPHLHCIVPAAGLINGNWKNIRGDGKFLFPVKALSKVLGHCAALRESPDNYTRVKKQLWEKQWSFCQKPLVS